MASAEEGESDPLRSHGTDEGCLPLRFLRWQASSRLELTRTVREGRAGSVQHMPSHLPVMATYDGSGEVCLACKGIGLVPRSELLAPFTSTFESVGRESAQRPWAESVDRRLEALLELYRDASNFDPRLLGGLEIFESGSYRNLLADARAVLLFTGGAPDFVSYEVRGKIEFVERGDPYYRYLLAARELFAHDPFHVLQRDYPHGFLLRVLEVRDKQPFTRS